MCTQTQTKPHMPSAGGDGGCLCGDCERVCRLLGLGLRCTASNSSEQFGQERPVCRSARAQTSSSSHRRGDIALAADAFLCCYRRRANTCVSCMFVVLCLVFFVACPCPCSVAEFVSSQDVLQCARVIVSNGVCVRVCYRARTALYLYIASKHSTHTHSAIKSHLTTVTVVCGGRTQRASNTGACARDARIVLRLFLLLNTFVHT